MRIKQIDRLYDQLVTWLYERQDARRSLPIANRLERLLARFSPKPETIFIEECRSLVCEAKGDLKNAIEHRENEIRLIRRLHAVSQGTESEPYVFSQYDYTDLSKRLDILAMLCHDTGNMDKAISILYESKKLCEEHGFKFDGETLLRDYQEETLTVNLAVESNGHITILPWARKEMETDTSNVPALESKQGTPPVMTTPYVAASSDHPQDQPPVSKPSGACLSDESRLIEHLSSTGHLVP